MRAAVLALALCLAACASRQPASGFGPQKPYVVLPGNYIVDLAGGARIGLNPQNGDFQLFVSPELARKALKEAGFSGDWRVYRVNGDMDEIGETAANGQRRLAVPVEIEDWVQ